MLCDGTLVWLKWKCRRMPNCCGNET